MSNKGGGSDNDDDDNDDNKEFKQPRRLRQIKCNLKTNICAMTTIWQLLLFVRILHC